MVVKVKNSFYLCSALSFVIVMFFCFVFYYYVPLAMVGGME